MMNFEWFRRKLGRYRVVEPSSSDVLRVPDSGSTVFRNLFNGENGTEQLHKIIATVPYRILQPTREHSCRSRIGTDEHDRPSGAIGWFLSRPGNGTVYPQGTFRSELE